MTREEAIELLDDVIGFVEDNQGRDYDAAFRMAIEALTQDSRKATQDLISRQDAIAYFFRPYSNEELYSNTDIEKALNALPSAEPKTGWIPVSERLPDIGDTFLVTVMVGTEIKTDVASNFGSYIDGFWDTFNDWIEDKECHVIAWMPLPEPYRGGGDK